MQLRAGSFTLYGEASVCGPDDITAAGVLAIPE
jgi:hypothetical protein